jgi:hypothetical protein
MALSFGLDHEDHGQEEAQDRGQETGSEDSDAEFEIPDTHCPACEQEFGTQDAEACLQLRPQVPNDGGIKQQLYIDSTRPYIILYLNIYLYYYIFIIYYLYII